EHISYELYRLRHKPHRYTRDVTHAFNMDLTKAMLKTMCRDNGQYSSPELNDKLYLHYKGIRQIQNLDEYTGLRVLWLEGNGLCKLEGMGAQTQLRTLYAHENLIEKIEGLESFLQASGFRRRDEKLCCL
ncbi:unnamed protein product, partial [Hapterophycus canaliculatus]